MITLLNKPQYIFWALGVITLLMSYAARDNGNMAIQVTNHFIVFALWQILLVFAVFALLSGTVYAHLPSRHIPTWILMTHLLSWIAALCACYWSYKQTMLSSITSLQTAQTGVYLALLLFGLSVLSLFALLFQFFLN